MILESLYRLAEREQLLDDPDFETKPVAWLVRVGENGRLLGITGTHFTPPAEGRRQPQPQAKSFRIPRQPTGRSGTKAPPAFCVDNAKYVFGRSTADKQFSAAEGAEKSGWFRDLVASCASSTNDEGIIAVGTLLDRIRTGEEQIELPEECRSNDLFAFIYSPDVELLVHERPAVRAWWKAQRSSGEGVGDEERRCLVTGQLFGGVVLFPLLKKVPGGNTAGAALVSFNANAFESYGWKGNENAPISRDAAEAAATALNRLLHPAYPDPRPQTFGQPLPRRNLRISADTALCFWTDGADEFADIIAAVMEADDPERVPALYRSLWRGEPVQLDDPSAFYALTLAGAQGRAMIRDWFETHVTEVDRNLAQYFRELTVVRNTPPPKGKALSPQVPLRALLASLAPFGRSDQVPAPLVARLVNAALRGTDYPLAVLQRVLERTRAEIGRTDWADLERRDARAALIKAVLLRNTRHTNLTPHMDPTNTEIGYRLGRLMAVLERLQQVALGKDVNATVVDRFFGAASATPQSVFPRLLKNARHHARKVSDDKDRQRLAGWLDGQIDEILSPLKVEKHRQGLPYTGFPRHLDLEQQGLFVLGYHQQRHWLSMKKEDRERLEAGRSAVAS